jgi:hypothetical protein
MLVYNHAQLDFFNMLHIFPLVCKVFSVPWLLPFTTILTMTLPFLTLQQHLLQLIPSFEAAWLQPRSPLGLSGQVTLPSARITDPDNAEASAGTCKRSATMMAPDEASLRAAHRAKLSGDDSSNDDSEQRDEPDTDEDIGGDDNACNY